MEAQILCTCCFSHLDHSGQGSLGLLSSQDGEARVSVPHGWGAVPPLPGALTSPGWEDPLRKGMATDSSILAWEITRTKEAGGLQSIGALSQTRLSN